MFLLMNSYSCYSAESYQSKVVDEPISYGGCKALIEGRTEESGIIIVWSLE